MSHSTHLVTLARPRQEPTTGAATANRLQLDFVTWRALLAAPGSRFAPAPPAPLSIINRDATSVLATDPPERRTA